MFMPYMLQPDLYPVGTIGPALRRIDEAKRICRASQRRPRAWPGRWTE